MQIYLPYASFKRSLCSLQQSTLKKQVSDARYLITIIKQIQYQDFLDCGKIGGASTYVCKMWQHHLAALCLYHAIAIAVSGTEEKTISCNGNNIPNMPWWFGVDVLHDAHKAELYRSNPTHYTDFSSVGPDLQMVWPVTVNGRQQFVEY